MQSSIVRTVTSKDSTSRSGSQVYKKYKDLVAEHGEALASSLRASRKQQQLSKGDAYPDCPHWYKHPDWPEVEATWCNQLKSSLGCQFDDSQLEAKEF